MHIQIQMAEIVYASGEEWQVSKVGAYLPGAHEEVVDIVNAFILTDKVPSSVPFPVVPRSKFNFSIHTLSRQVIRDWGLIGLTERLTYST